MKLWQSFFLLYIADIHLTSKILTTNCGIVDYDNPEVLTSKNLISKTEKRGGRQHLPFVFTEQGIYMLMTVLKGDLATEQSKVLIRSRRSSGLPSDRGRVVEQSGVVILKTSERPLNFFQENCKIL